MAQHDLSLLLRRIVALAVPVAAGAAAVVACGSSSSSSSTFDAGAGADGDSSNTTPPCPPTDCHCPGYTPPMLADELVPYTMTICATAGDAGDPDAGDASDAGTDAGCLVPDPAAATLPMQDCRTYCPMTNFLSKCKVAGIDGGTTIIACTPGLPGCGRRPFALVLGDLGPCSTVGGYLARAARLEAASVDAFRILGEELTALGAPSMLVRATQRAAADEVRHARTMAALARSHGSEVVRDLVPRHAPRGAFDVALENAVEGCVRETYGALVAAFQAETASDSRIRSAMTVIAEEEARHAELSLDVDRWLRTQLTARERVALDEAREHAIAALAGELDGLPGGSVGEVVGLPGPAIAERLLRELDTRLFHAAA